jgi:hypothetical protein
MLLEGIASDAGVEVVFTDSTSGLRNGTCLLDAHVFVHPSGWESGVPFAVLEAMLVSRPS